jgi:hypothetical protein
LLSKRCYDPHFLVVLVPPLPPMLAHQEPRQVSAQLSYWYRAGIASVSPKYGVGINRKCALPWTPCGIDPVDL